MTPACDVLSKYFRIPGIRGAYIATAVQENYVLFDLHLGYQPRQTSMSAVDKRNIMCWYTVAKNSKCFRTIFVQFISNEYPLNVALTCHWFGDTNILLGIAKLTLLTNT